MRTTYRGAMEWQLNKYKVQDFINNSRPLHDDEQAAYQSFTGGQFPTDDEQKNIYIMKDNWLNTKGAIGAGGRTLKFGDKIFIFLKEADNKNFFNSSMPVTVNNSGSVPQLSSKPKPVLSQAPNPRAQMKRRYEYEKATKQYESLVGQQKLLIHEMTHVLQGLRGRDITYDGVTIQDNVNNKDRLYNEWENESLIRDYEDYGMEEQAEILEDRFLYDHKQRLGEAWNNYEIRANAILASGNNTDWWNQRHFTPTAITSSRDRDMNLFMRNPTIRGMVKDRGRWLNSNEVGLLNNLFGTDTADWTKFRIQSEYKKRLPFSSSTKWATLNKVKNEGSRDLEVETVQNVLVVGKDKGIYSVTNNIQFKSKLYKDNFADPSVSIDDRVKFVREAFYALQEQKTPSTSQYQRRKNVHEDLDYKNKEDVYFKWYKEATEIPASINYKDLNNYVKTIQWEKQNKNDKWRFFQIRNMQIL